MRDLKRSFVYHRALIAGLLVVLPAAPLFALKPPVNAVQPASPAADDLSEVENKRPPPEKSPRAKPARPSSERVQADSAVSFPVDI
jgi:hypothetical protein